MEDRKAVQSYQLSWRAILKLARSGSSWSGHERNCVYLNTGNANGALADEGGADSSMASFANISAISGLDFSDDGRSIAAVDWDHDGDLDLWLRNRSGPRLRLMRNRTRTNSKVDGRANFVAFHLQGTSSNRDAIGARVEVRTGSENRPLVKTLRAGDAFLSQSSKWLHFGLANTSATSVFVAWPNGTQETFDALQTNGFYILKQGSGRAKPWRRAQAAELLAKTILPTEATAAARVVLPGRIPLPTIDLRFPESGQPIERAASVGKKDAESPVRLIKFWTSSCPNCRRELTELAGQALRVQQTGLEVVAVCLDGVEDRAGQASDDPLADVQRAEEVRDPGKNASKFLASINFPFKAASTDVDSVDRFRNFQNTLFDQFPDFVVPLSLLVDGDGQLLAIYRGAFSLDLILDDLQLVDMTEQQLRSLATPFAGTWFTKPASRSELAEYVGQRLYAEDTNEGLRFFELAMHASNDSNRKAALRRKVVDTHFALAGFHLQKNDRKAAIEHLQNVLRLEPAHELANKNLAILQKRSN